MENHPRKILITEDEIFIAMAEASMLEDNGYKVVTAVTGEKAIAMISEDPEINLVLMDIDLGKGMSGPDAAKKILEIRDIPVVFLTSHSEKEMVDRVKAITRYGYLIKNSGDFIILSSIEMAYELFNAHKSVETKMKILSQSERSLAITLDSIGDAVIATDTKGRITRMNPVAERLTGWKFENVFMEPLKDVFIIRNFITGNFVENPVDIVLKKGSVVGLANHTVLISRDGNEYQISDSAAPIRDGDGIIQGIILTFSDVTEKYLNSEKIRTSEKRLREAQEMAHVGNWEFNPATGKIWGSENAFRMYDLIYAESGEMDIDEVENRIEDKEIVHQALVDLIEKNIPYDVEIRLKPVLNSPGRIIHSRATLIRNENGTPVLVHGVLQDITDRKLAEAALKESEEKSRAAFMTSPDAININTLEGRYVDINDGFTSLTGFTRDDAIGLLSTEMGIWTIPEDRDKLIKGLKENGFVMNLESVFRCKDGSLKTALMSARFINIKNIPHILSITRDITDRKKHEQIIETSQKDFEVIFKSSAVLMAISSIEEGVYIDVNEVFLSTLGYSREEVIGKSSCSLNIWVEPSGRSELMKVLQEKGSIRNIRAKFRKKNGDIIDAIFSIDYINLFGKRHLLSSVVDISDKIKTNEALEDEKLFSSTILESLPGIFYMFDYPSLKLVRWNKNHEKALGYTSDEMKGKHLYDWHIKNSEERIQKSLKDLFEKGEKKVEALIVSKDGTETPYLLTGIRFESHGKLFMMGVGIDISEQKKNYEKYIETEDIFSQFLENSPIYIFFKDHEIRTLRLSKNYEKMLGRSLNELIGKTMDDLFPSDLAKSMIADDKRVLKEGKQVEIEEELNGRCFNTLKFPLKREGKPSYLAGYTIDITEQKQNEKRIRKLLGEKEVLLAEVHHRIKNNMMTIAGLLSLQAKSTTNKEASGELLEAYSRVQSMMMIYDKLYRSKNYQNISSKEYLSDLISGVAGTFAGLQKISVNSDIDDMSIDAKQMYPVGIILNELMTNSFKYAFPDGRDGMINISFKEMPGNIIVIKISDNGIGVAKSGNHDGHKGFGLKLVDLIAKQIEGEIECLNGSGTGYNITFKYDPVG